MITDGVAEILVGINVDPQFGQLLVLGAGGVLTELLRGQRHAAAAVHRLRHRGGARAAQGGAAPRRFPPPAGGGPAGAHRGGAGVHALRRGQSRAAHRARYQSRHRATRRPRRGGGRCPDPPRVRSPDMSDGIKTASTRPRGAILEVTIDRPKANAIDLAASRRLNEVFSPLPRRPGAARRDRHRRRRAFLQRRLGPQGRGGRRGIRRGLGRGRLRRPQLPAQPRQAAHRGGQRHRLRRRLRDRARHRHHRDGGAREVRAAGDQRRGAGGCRHHQAAAAHSLPRRGRVPDDRTLDGRRRGQALGPGQPRGAKGQGSRARERSRSSSPTARRCCSRRSSSCCATPRWSPSTRRSSCTTPERGAAGDPLGGPQGRRARVRGEAQAGVEGEVGSPGALAKRVHVTPAIVNQFVHHREQAPTVRADSAARAAAAARAR